VNHIAIDLGSRESQICVRDSVGKILHEQKLANRDLLELLDCPNAVVSMETCSEAFAVADWARRKGHQVRVVPSTLVRSLGVGARRVKTDRRDAQALSEASCRIDLPSVHVPSSWSREVKTICSLRDALVSSRSKCVNSVRGWLRAQLFRPRLARTSLPRKLRENFASRGHSLPACVERQLVAIEGLSEQIKAADVEIDAMARASEVCVLLMSAPGVGPQTALRFAAALDGCDRFSDAHRVASYLGLAPGEDSSSMRKRITSITKAGSASVRWLLVEAAWSALRWRPDDPMCRWAKRVGERRGRKIAVTALARKLAGVLYAIWRTRKPYDPAHTTSTEPAV
jgi:transposase